MNGALQLHPGDAAESLPGDRVAGNILPAKILIDGLPYRCNINNSIAFELVPAAAAAPCTFRSMKEDAWKAP
jgi:hypothetical protein